MLALPLPRRRGCGDAAGADAERHQRRRARRQLDRPAGVHGRPGRRRLVRRGAADRRRGLPRAEEGARASAGSRPASATRAGSRPTCRRARPRSRRSSRRPSAPGHRERVAIALDPASSEIYRGRRLPLRGPRGRAARRCPTSGPGSSTRYPIVSIEDGLAEDDWDAWKALTERLGDRVQLVGDDIFVTNPERLQRGIDAGVAQLDPGQGEPDRHADRDARRGRGSRSAPATRR